MTLDATLSTTGELLLVLDYRHDGANGTRWMRNGSADDLLDTVHASHHDLESLRFSTVSG